MPCLTSARCPVCQWAVSLTAYGWCVFLGLWIVDVLVLINSHERRLMSLMATKHVAPFYHIMRQSFRRVRRSSLRARAQDVLFAIGLCLWLSLGWCVLMDLWSEDALVLANCHKRHPKSSLVTSRPMKITQIKPFLSRGIKIIRWIPWVSRELAAKKLAAYFEEVG